MLERHKEFENNRIRNPWQDTSSEEEIDEVEEVDR